MKTQELYREGSQKGEGVPRFGCENLDGIIIFDGIAAAGPITFPNIPYSLFKKFNISVLLLHTSLHHSLTCYQPPSLLPISKTCTINGTNPPSSPRPMSLSNDYRRVTNYLHLQPPTTKPPPSTERILHYHLGQCRFQMATVAQYLQLQL